MGLLKRPVDEMRLGRRGTSRGRGFATGVVTGLPMGLVVGLVRGLVTETRRTMGLEGLSWLAVGETPLGDSSASALRSYFFLVRLV